MTQEESEAIQKAGAVARAIGKHRLDCPYYNRELCPLATGETYEQWSAKVTLWELGWEMEDAIRRSREAMRRLG